MRVPVNVRSTSALHYPDKIDSIVLDSFDRLELIQQKYSKAGSNTKTRLYFAGMELALNSSVGSHNFDNDAIIECCKSPALSAACTAVLKDFEEIQKIPEGSRTREHLMKWLTTPMNIHRDASHDIWKVSEWSNEKLKNRMINLALIKSVLQRQNRWEVHDLPECLTCLQLYRNLEERKVWTGGRNIDGRNQRAFSSHSHIFKPQKNNGNPSTNYLLLDEKMCRQGRMRFQFDQGTLQYTTGFSNPPLDYIEEFVRKEHARHPSLSSRRSRSNDDEPHLDYVRTPPRRSASSSRGATSSATPRRSTPASQPRPRVYTPQFESGPYAVLATLHNAMHGRLGAGRRQLTLSESDLKRYGQRMCRSNLYDKSRQRGRNAFACIDGLVKKNLLRKEIIRGPTGEDVEKYGLLQEGEKYGEACAAFAGAVDQVFPIKPFPGTVRGSLALCLDTREDVHLLNRARGACQDNNVSFSERELPAGDYIFTRSGIIDDTVAPIVIERKSWSDLADSCRGKGRTRSRLDCVRLGGDGNCNGCQVCRMKRCGLKNVMFMIEGERCLAADSSPNRPAKACSADNPCTVCKGLLDRHEISQEQLERVLTKLQSEHGCFVHYTKSYNETIEALFDIREVLERMPNAKDIPYSDYLSRSRSSDMVVSSNRPSSATELSIMALLPLAGGDWGRVGDLLGVSPSAQSTTRRQGESSRAAGVDGRRQKKRRKPNDEPIITLDSDDSDDSVKVVNIRGGGYGSDDFGEDYVVESQSVQFMGFNLPDDDTRDELNESQESVLLVDNRDDGGGKKKAAIDLSDSDSDSDDSILYKDSGLGSTKKSPPQSRRTLAAASKIDKSTSNAANDDNDDEICLLDSSDDENSSTLVRRARAPPSSSRPPRPQKRRASQTEAPLKINGNSGSAIIVINGWADYEIALGKHLDNLWKDLFSQQRPSDITAEAITRLSGLEQLMGNEVVRRRTLQRLILWIQIVCNVKVRSLNQASMRHEIRMQLGGGGSLPARGRAVAASSQPANSSSTSALRRTASNSAAIAQVTAPKSNSQSDMLREARLRRFESSASASATSSSLPTTRPPAAPQARSTTTKSSATWSCPRCTLENDITLEKCQVCEADAPGKMPALALSSTFAAAAFHDALPVSSSDHHQAKSSATKRKQKCGACGLEGHNRATATAQNCPAYNDPNEVERRRKKREQKEAQLREARSQVGDLDQQDVRSRELSEEIKRKMEELDRANRARDATREQMRKQQQQRIRRLERDLNR